MLHLIPPPLHRAALRIAHGLRKHWWRLAKPRIQGCRVVALDQDGRVLMIRHSYGSGMWMLPGGGIKRGECPKSAAAREMQEETGCRLNDPQEIAQIDAPLHGHVHRVHVIGGRASGILCPDGREVLEAGFFALGGLPEAMPDFLREELPVWVRIFRM